MSTPKGMRCTTQHLSTGEKILIYSNTDQIVLQVRRQIPTEEQLLEPSFKVAVVLVPTEALAVASDLLQAALRQIKHEPGTVPGS